ncbi:MAG: hypothetical protein AAF517_18240 [Planctomycetota bacterium]
MKVSLNRRRSLSSVRALAGFAVALFLSPAGLGLADDNHPERELQGKTELLTTPDEAVRTLVSVIERNVIQPAAKGVAKGDEAGLRALWDKVVDAAAKSDSSRRSLVLRGARSSLLTALTHWDSSAATAIDAARKTRNGVRRIALLEKVICWCPKEDWTRSLAGCFENCANAQKSLIDELLDKSFTDDEIFDRMIKEAGTTEVIGKERSFLLSFAPYGILGLAVLVGLFLLSRSLASRPKGEAEPPLELGATAGSSGSEDGEWGDRLESALKEIDD